MRSPSTLVSISDLRGDTEEKVRRTLLIVDDEEGPRQSLRVVFKEEYNLLLASNGPDAVELAKNNRINAAVLDIRMTGMSGTELLRQARALRPALRVILISGMGAVKVDPILGNVTVLQKPLRAEEFLRRVKEALPEE